MWCVLGTLGSFLVASRSALRFRFSPPALLWPRGDAATDWPGDMSLESLSDLEGFDDEHRRWWPRPMKGVDAAAAALGAEEAKDGASPPAWGAVATTRRTDEGSMIEVTSRSPAEQRERGSYRVGDGGWGTCSEVVVGGVTSKPGFGRRAVENAAVDLLALGRWGASCEWPKAAITGP